MFPIKKKGKKQPPPQKQAPAMAPDPDGGPEDTDDANTAGPIEAATKSYDTATQTFRKGKKSGSPKKK